VLSKLNSLLRITCVLFLIAPTSIALADHVPTQTPYDISIACDSSNGDITVTWQESDGFESSPPERYAIGFDVNENGTADAYAVANSTGWETALSYKSYVFSASYRESIFGNTQGTFNAKVRADNDTDSSYSEWTSTVGIACNYGGTTTTSTTTTTLPPAVPDDATNVSVNYQGKDVYFAWEYTEGNTLAKEFHINYSYDNSIWDRVVITDTSARIYTLDYTNIQTGTFYWTFSVCGDIENGESCTDSDSNNFETYEYVAPTTTLAPVVEEVYVEPEPLPPPPEEIIVDIVVEGVDKTYTQADVNDGTIERDQERIDNEKEFGCFMTNAQIKRGDCDIPTPVEEVKEEVEEEVIIIIDEEQKSDTEGELFNDDDLVLEVVVEDEVEELESIEDKDIVEEEIKIDIKNIEEEFKFEEEEIVIEIIEDVIIEIVEDEIVEDELVKEVFTDESEAETEVQEQDTPVKEEEVELTEEEVKIEVAELEEVIEEIVVIDIPKATEEELEEFTEEELIEYEEAKEEAIEEFVEELETEEVVEILEEVNDVGLDNIAEVSQEVIEVVAQVVEEVITIAQEEVLTQEQTEVVAEVLGFTETKDVEIIAEAVKTDDNVAQAVDEFVERAVEFAKTDSDQEFTLADATTEIAFESFIESPVSVIIDIDLDAINLNNIANDMTTDQKEKAQEVIVPTILVRIVSFAMRRFD